MAHIPTGYFSWRTSEAPLDREKRVFLDTYVVGKTVLDIGCATGVYANYLSGKGYEVTGVDQQRELIGIAKKRNQHAHFLIGDITKIRLPLKQYDTVIAFDILEHLQEDAVWQKLQKITNKRLLVSVPQTTDAGLANLYLLYGHHLDTTHLKTYTEAALKTLATRYAFRLSACIPSHPLATEALAMEIWEGNILLKKMSRKLMNLFLKPKRYTTNLLAVLDQSEPI